jgi:hypothetical protein
MKFKILQNEEIKLIRPRISSDIDKTIQKAINIPIPYFRIDIQRKNFKGKRCISKHT